MPHSRRSKLLSLTRTKKQTQAGKVAHVERLRQSVDDHRHVFVISVDNMRNSLLKQVRADWPSSSFFFGKNKIMGVALGKNADSEYKPNLHRVSASMKGSFGLMFTDAELEEVQTYFSTNQVAEYARTGFTSNIDFTIPEGVIDLPFSMEPTLRQLGLDTKLNKGVIETIREHKVCSVGDVLTPEQARLLRLFEQKVATFKIDILHSWTDGQFVTVDSCQMDTEQ